MVQVCMQRYIFRRYKFLRVEILQIKVHSPFSPFYSSKISNMAIIYDQNVLFHFFVWFKTFIPNIQFCNWLSNIMNMKNIYLCIFCHYTKNFFFSKFALYHNKFSFYSLHWKGVFCDVWRIKRCTILKWLIEPHDAFIICFQAV